MCTYFKLFFLEIVYRVMAHGACQHMHVFESNLERMPQYFTNKAWLYLLELTLISQLIMYCVGATLSKGLNRGLGTIMAASLGLMIDYFANFVGPKIEPYVVGCSIFFVGTCTHYLF